MSLSSFGDNGRNGGKKQLSPNMILLLVGVAHIVDLHVVGTGDALRSAVVCFYLSNETVSMLENAAHLGLPIPEKLKSVLAQLHGRIDDIDHKESGQQ